MYRNEFILVFIISFNSLNTMSINKHGHRFIITDTEQKFLNFYQSMRDQKKFWTFRHASIALGYKSVNSINRIVKDLRKKGFNIETERSNILRWKRDLPKSELKQLKTQTDV